MTLKFDKRNLFAASHAAMADDICMARAICLLISSAQTASADDGGGGQLRTNRFMRPR